MFQSTTRHAGYNREIKDAMELQGLDYCDLASLLGIDEESCRRELTKEEDMIKIKRMAWLSKIFKMSFDTLRLWQIFIAQLIEERGPDWLEEPPLIEGSTRYYHQLYNQYRPSRKKEASDDQ